MATEVTLASNRLQYSVDGELKNSVTYSNIVSMNYLTEEIGRQMTSNLLMGAPTYSSISEQWLVVIKTRTGTESIPLGNVTGQPTWTNDYAGYVNAETDIYANF